LSSGYQKKVTGTGLLDDTYKDDGVALFRVEGTGRHNTKAVQVDLVSISVHKKHL
jgi:gelsolin